MEHFMKNALPGWLSSWLSNPEIMLKWIEANQVVIGLYGGAFLFLYIGACLMLRRILLRKKGVEFGAHIWANEDKDKLRALRERGLIRKDL